MLDCAPMRRLLPMFALLLAPLTAAASDHPCVCSAYFRVDNFNAMVIDNESGLIDYVDAAQYDFIDPAPAFKVRPRSPDIDMAATDCSVEGLSCVEIHGRHGTRTLLAFKQGATGDTYSIRGISFKI